MSRLSWLYELAVLALVKIGPFAVLAAVPVALYLAWRAFR